MTPEQTLPDAFHDFATPAQWQTLARRFYVRGETFENVQPDLGFNPERPYFTAFLRQGEKGLWGVLDAEGGFHT